MRTVYNSVEDFEVLPQEVKDKILKDLVLYNKTYCYRRGNNYQVSVDSCLDGVQKEFVGVWSYIGLVERYPELKEKREEVNRKMNNISDSFWD